MDEEQSRSRGQDLLRRARASLVRASEKSADGLRRTRDVVSEALGSAAERIRESEAGERLKATLDTQRVIKRASDAQARGNAPMAFRLLEEEWRAKPHDEKLALAFWNAAAAAGRGPEAADAVIALVRRRASRGELEAAAGLWIVLVAEVPEARLDAGSLVRMIPALEELDRERAIDALRRAVDPETLDLTPGLAVRAAELARSLDPAAAAAAARVALASPEIDASRREKLEALVRELEDEGSAGTEDAPQKTSPAEPVPAARETPAQVAVEMPPLPMPEVPPQPVPEVPPQAPVEAVAQVSVEVSSEAGAETPPQAAPDVSVQAAPDLPPDAEPDLPPDAAPDVSSPAALAEPVQDDPAPIDAPQAPPFTAEEPAPGHEDFSELVIEETLEAVDRPVRFGELKVMQAAPLGLTEDGVRLAVDGGRRAMLAYGKIQAMAVAEVAMGDGSRTWIDLALNWEEPGAAVLRVVRLRADHFEPDDLANEITGPQTLRGLLAQLLSRSGALPLPNLDGALGDPLHIFEDEATYLREVLGVA